MNQRPKRSRSAGVETALKTAALDLLETEGILSGFTLAEVAERAGVNRSVAYRRFGDRQTLLREALESQGAAELDEAYRERGHLPFAIRYLGNLDSQIAQPEFIRNLLLRLIDKDPSVSAMHYGSEPIARLLRDRTNGVLPADIDVRAVRAASQSITYGYVLFRKWMAEEQAMELGELDEMIRPIFQRIFEALQATSANAPDTTHDASAAPS